MTVMVKVGREFIEEAYKSGLVKPNEYKALRDFLVQKEIEVRKLLYKGDKRWLAKLGLFLYGEARLLSEQYNTHVSSSVESNIIELARRESFDSFSLTEEEVRTIKLADFTYKKAIEVRNLGDMNRCDILEVDSPIYTDKVGVRALEFLLNRKQACYDMLNMLQRLTNKS